MGSLKNYGIAETVNILRGSLIEKIFVDSKTSNNKLTLVKHNKIITNCYNTTIFSSNDRILIHNVLFKISRILYDLLKHQKVT